MILPYYLAGQVIITQGVSIMGITYKKLWKLLIDRDMLKKDLREGCDLSTASMAKLAKGRNINTDVLVRVCNFLRCDIMGITIYISIIILTMIAKIRKKHSKSLTE